MHTVEQSADTGGPAFPVPDSPNYDTEKKEDQIGMTLRDYFAAKAMQGLAVAFPDWSHHEITRAAYGQADAMLEARK